MPDQNPLLALSARVHDRAIVHRNSFQVLRDYEIGGPEDPADRRLILDREGLEELLALANSSHTGRVVCHHLGLRVRVLRDPDSGHRWEELTLIGSAPRAERVSIGSGIK